MAVRRALDGIALWRGQAGGGGGGGHCAIPHAIDSMHSLAGVLYADAIPNRDARIVVPIDDVVFAFASVR